MQTFTKVTFDARGWDFVMLYLWVNKVYFYLGNIGMWDENILIRQMVLNVIEYILTKRGYSTSGKIYNYKNDCHINATVCC